MIQSGRIDDEAALVAKHDWRTWWARENQLAPLGDWHIWLCLAGRGWGKTRTGVEWFIEQAAIPDQPPMALVGRTAADVRDTLVEGPAGILRCSPPWNKPHYQPSIRRLTWRNGNYATTFSAEEPDSLRGPNFGKALADEIAAWPRFEDAWSNLLMATRLGDAPRIAALTTPRPLKILRDLIDEPDVAITRGRTYDNRANLARQTLAYLEKRFAGTRRGQQELEGILLVDLPGALWTKEMLDAANKLFQTWGRPSSADLFERIVVAVDPSGSEGEGEDDGDAQGIIVAGKLARQDRYVVLEDLTGQRRPEQWASVAVKAARRWGADSIIAEKNYGGAMVRAVIQHANPDCPVRLVTASKGKTLRAQPVSMLYEQEKVAHSIGVYNLTETEEGGEPVEPRLYQPGIATRGLVDLEEEYSQFTGSEYTGKRSPNRADAAVFALTALAGLQMPEPNIRSLG